VDETTDHDQSFKSVIRAFLPDFLTLFLPDLAAGLDLTAVSWLNQELFPNPPDGPKHVLDLVAELRTLGGDASTLALIHVEVESAESATDIESRLPDYYHYLRRTQRKALLADCVEAYIDIPAEETRRFRDILEGNATGRVPQMHKTRVQIAEELAAQRGMARGLEEGMEKGVEVGRKASVLKVLAARIGAVPPDLAARVDAMADPTALDSLLVAACKADTFDQFRAAVGG